MYKACPLHGVTNLFLGRSVQNQRGLTPHKQTPPPKQGYVPPREDRPHPRRVVTGLKNLHKNVNYYFSPPQCLLNIKAKNCPQIELGPLL